MLNYDIYGTSYLKLFILSGLEFPCIGVQTLETQERGKKERQPQESTIKTNLFLKTELRTHKKL